MNQDLRSKLAGTEMLILDVDGVLTDGRLLYGSGGIEMKAFNVHDGHGLKKVQQEGVSIAIVSGRTSDIVEKRADELGIRFLYQNVVQKDNVLKELTEKSGIDPRQMAHVGDDLPDLALFRHVGLGIAVANARPEVRKSADFTTEAKGGEGAVREVCELLLASRLERNA
ncbi:MAG: HAD hydrolase family protein [Pseudomonadota bacterium]|nr:HAD hydrolase family protein [Pseudomonadota bacterium]